MKRERRPSLTPGIKLRGKEKVDRIPVKIIPTTERLRKPKWIRAKIGQIETISTVKNLLRKRGLNTVCEEAACPNIAECFGHGTATFMIMGDICTRRCPFCDVAHGRPKPLNEKEPLELAEAINDLKLKYVVITSVDRDDLLDGGAGHFVACIQEVRKLNPNTKVEVLVPDFRGRMDVALALLKDAPPDVFNHNLETVPRLYLKVRPGSDYKYSLNLLKEHKKALPNVPTKSGIMLGLGESFDEIKEVLHDLRAHNVDMVTLGQYLQPSKHHLPVDRYITPEEFDELGDYAKSIGFSNVASGPMVRSSYHADLQAQEVV